MTIDEALAIMEMERPRSNKIDCPAGHGSGKTPPLHLYDDNFYCYNCGKNGDAYGFIAFMLGRDVADVLREYGDGEGKPHPVVTRRRMLEAVRADWLDFQGHYWHAYHMALADLASAMRNDAIQMALDRIDHLWDGPLTLNDLDEDMSPHDLQQQVDEAKAIMVDTLNVQVDLAQLRNPDTDYSEVFSYGGLQGPAVQSKVPSPGRPGGSSLRAGSATRSVREVRVGATEGVDGEDVGSSQALSRLLRRRLSR